MPLDMMKIAAAMGSGVSAVCSCCVRYHEGRDAGLPGASCTSPGPCGSPISGMTFPNYVGPMAQFDRFCFVCGNQSTQAIRVRDDARVIGVCSAHIETVKTLKPEGGQAANVVVMSKEGESKISADDAPGKRSGLIKIRG